MERRADNSCRPLAAMDHAGNADLPKRIFSILAFGVTVLIWRWLARQNHLVWLNPIVALGGPILVLPVTWLGRAALDRNSTSAHASAVTRLVHFAVMTLMGAALICAALASAQAGWALIPFPPRIADWLTWITGVALLATVLNLAARGLGAPFAIALSKRLATDWMYARTRNPMLLCLFAFLICSGLRMRSALFVGWVVVVSIPVMLIFVRFYEERELQIRFGPAYLQYRAGTPMLLPRLRRNSVR